MEQLKWKGFKEVKVVDKVKESKGVYSFYLKDIDNKNLPEFLAGQFIAIRVKNKDNTYTSPRQYTLSMNHKDDFYRVSIKREENGYVSKKLVDEVEIGDTIEITMPLGKFYLKDNNKNVVLIGGGIGITPMLTMAYEAANTSKNVELIYSTQNAENHSFKDEIEKLCNENSNIKSTTFYTRVNEEKDNSKYIAGRMSRKWMEENLDKDSEFYFCGPTEFMRSVYKNLISMGINKEDINFEMFDAGTDITK